MIPNADGKPESVKDQADQLMQLLEIELAQKRAAWNQTSAHYRKIRNASFFFLFLLIIGSLFAGFVIFTRVNERRGSQPSSSAPQAPR
jgi:hypothetical protein